MPRTQRRAKIIAFRRQAFGLHDDDGPQATFRDDVMRWTRDSARRPSKVGLHPPHLRYCRLRLSILYFILGALHDRLRQTRIPGHVGGRGGDVAASFVRAGANAGLCARRHGSISSHAPERRLRVATKLSAVPEKFRRCRIGRGREHELRSRKIRQLRRRKHDGVSVAEAQSQKQRGIARRVPVSSVQFMPSGPIPDGTLPLDEYFCRFRLQAPIKMFIGFQVDVPYSRVEARFDWFSNVTSSPTARAWVSTGPAAI